MEKEKKKKAVLDPYYHMSDGRQIACYVNMETERDIDAVLQQKVAGVGIFRTEFLCVAEKGVPSMERQAQIYTALAEKLSPLPFVIRLFDFGADKCDLLFGKKNPFGKKVSARGVGFLLQHPKILQDQLCAIMRASSIGNVRLLLPFVSSLEDVCMVKKMIDTIKQKTKKFSLGAMIEVPAAALMADQLVQEVDFLSIGTNDLVHYLFGLDRNQASAFSKDIVPSLRRVLQMVVCAAKDAKKPLILCGEMAAHKELLPIFLELGIESFSLSTAHLSAFKERMQALHVIERAKSSMLSPQRVRSR